MFYPLSLRPSRAAFGNPNEFGMAYTKAPSPVPADEVGGYPARGKRPETDPCGEERA